MVATPMELACSSVTMDDMISRPDPIDVVVVDDQDSFRNAIADVISSVDGCRLVAALSSPEPLDAAIREHAPDLLLMDVRMPPYDGAAIALEMYEQHPTLTIILMSVVDRADIPHAVLDSGIGFITKAMLGPDAIAAARDRIRNA